MDYTARKKEITTNHYRGNMNPYKMNEQEYRTYRKMIKMLGKRQADRLIKTTLKKETKCT